MKTAFCCVAIAAALTLGACQTAPADLGYHTAVKFQATGVNINTTSGVSLAHVSATIDKAPTVSKGWTAIEVDPCKGDVPSTYSNMNSNASASANGVGPAASAITAPQVAIAAGDQTFNGRPAVHAAAGLTSNPADLEAAACSTPLPSATPGSIVRQGVSPSPAEAAAASK